MLRIVLLAFVFFPVLYVFASERQIVLLEDPINDDNGNGALFYPQRQDYQPGDLDLVSLRIIHHDASYRFEVSFRNPIRNPALMTGDVGPESLSHFARHGFYTFNVDIYIDQDRVYGSGNTYTLPGRQVSIDASDAWEKAIILTPRPELMRQQLIDAVTESLGIGETKSNPDKVAKKLDHSIIFPTEIHVHNRTVSFEVPDAFLSGNRPDTDWSITAFVTGAKTSIEANISLFSPPVNAIERISLGVLQPKSGHPRNTFGYTSVNPPGPVVDLLNPLPDKQKLLLSGTKTLAGVSWSEKAGEATAAERSNPVTSITNGLSPQTDTPSGMQKSINNRKNSIAERLKQLNDLRTQGLINDQEYGEIRRKILSEL